MTLDAGEDLRSYEKDVSPIGPVLRSAALDFGLLEWGSGVDYRV